jgi:hypothetical protein
MKRRCAQSCICWLLPTRNSRWIFVSIHILQFICLHERPLMPLVDNIFEWYTFDNQHLLHFVVQQKWNAQLSSFRCIYNFRGLSWSFNMRNPSRYTIHTVQYPYNSCFIIEIVHTACDWLTHSTRNCHNHCHDPFPRTGLPSLCASCTWGPMLGAPRTLRVVMTTTVHSSSLDHVLVQCVGSVL